MEGGLFHLNDSAYLRLITSLVKKKVRHREKDNFSVAGKTIVKKSWQEEISWYDC